MKMRRSPVEGIIATPMKSSLSVKKEEVKLIAQDSNKEEEKGHSQGRSTYLV